MGFIILIGLGVVVTIAMTYVLKFIADYNIANYVFYASILIAFICISISVTRFELIDCVKYACYLLALVLVVNLSFNMYFANDQLHTVINQLIANVPDEFSMSEEISSIFKHSFREVAFIVLSLLGSILMLMALMMELFYCVFKNGTFVRGKDLRVAFFIVALVFITTSGILYNFLVSISNS